MPLTELEPSSGLVSRVNRHAQRLECDQLAGDLKRCRAPESGSKLHALQTLRVVWWRLCLRVYRVSAVQRGVLQLHGCGQAGPTLTHSTNGLVLVEANTHAFGHHVTRGRPHGSQYSHLGLLPVHHTAQVAYVFDAGLAALDLKDDSLRLARFRVADLAGLKNQLLIELLAFLVPVLA